jgi:predicted membrane-bound spermidine synthase
MTWPDSLVFLVSFLLVLVPTLAMGATLPLLAKHFVAAEGNVGRAVSRLYFVNTLGSALAALLSASVVLGSLGLQKTVWLAAFTNFLVGSLALVHDRSHRMPSTASQEGSP